MASTDALNSHWPVEDIPDADLLYRRVHRDHIDKGEPMFGVFRNDGQGDAAGMSVDWSKYAEPQETQARGRKPASEYGVLALTVSDVRQIPRQEVLHEPEWPDNRAHTNVKGPKSKREGAEQEIRLRFLQITRWVLKYHTSTS